MAHPFVANSHILHRSFAAKPHRVVGSKGIRLILESGEEILDASAGPAVSCLGHSRPDVAQEVARQITDVAYVYSGARFTATASEDLASHILKEKPGGLSKAIFVNSGSEATDAALKLAFQYWREAGKSQKRYVIARKQSYHGNTIGALCVSGHDSRRELYKDWMSTNVSFVDPCFAYRFKHRNESDSEYVKRLENQLEAQILELGPENVAAFVAETVSGTTLGCAPATPGYFQAVRNLCDKYDILLILDEVRRSYSVSAFIKANNSSRSCAVWAKLVRCTLGNKKESVVPIFKPLAKLLVEVSFPFLGYFCTRKSSRLLRQDPVGWRMATLFR